IVLSSILFLVFDNPYFKKYIKALNPSYEPPKCSDFATSILDIEAANIIIKIDMELSKAKNLTLFIANFSKVACTTKFFVEKIIEELESIRQKKFIAIVSNTKSLMIAAK
ncbi:20578_t:CDS:2, partial [Gigaspora margarita]